MTTYSFSPNSTTAFNNWSDPTIWSTQSVPNSNTADVLLPPITDGASGQPLLLTVNIQAGQTFQVGDLDLLYGTIDNFGVLNVAHSVTVGAHGSFYNDATPGTLNAASFENDGGITSTGAYDISGTAINRGSLYGNFIFTAGTFENAGGTLQSTGNLVIAVADTHSGFANLTNGILTGGTYYPSAGSITFEVNSPITTLAAAVSLGDQGTLQTYAAAGTALVTLQSSLATIAPSGFLFADSYANAGPLTIAGAVTLNFGSFSAASVTVASSGVLSLNSGASAGVAVASLSVSGGITDNGTIVANINPMQIGDGSYNNSAVLIGSAVQGTGAIVVGPSVPFSNVVTHQQSIAVVSLEIAAADTATLIFADNTGTLKLDAPQSVTGTIEGFTQGDTMVLSGVSLSSVVSTTYEGTATRGTLTITESTGQAISLSLQGNYGISDFVLSPGPQQLSATPASLILTYTASAALSYSTVEAAAAAAQTGAMIVTTIADVAANLDSLQALKAAGQISNVILTDLDQPIGSGTGLPEMMLTAKQFLADSAALGAINSAYTVSVTGATVAQAESITGGAHVTSVTVSDSNADIVPQLDALQALAATGQVTSIAVTDSGFTGFFLTSTQLANDRAALGEMTGNFTVSVAASAANLELDGVGGHGTTAIFSGTDSEYAIASAGDGVGVTITDTGTGRTSVDLLRSINAVQFSDVTDIIARTPGGSGAGSVTTGNVTELYGAVFGRLPDLPGLAYYQGQLAQNPSLPLTTFAQWFLASPEYLNNPAHNYAQSTAGDTQFINDSYSNLLHRTPEAGAVPYYLNIIDSFTNGFTPGTAQYAAAQALAHAVVLTDFSASAEFLQDVQVTAATPSSAQHWLILM